MNTPCFMRSWCRRWAGLALLGIMPLAWGHADLLALIDLVTKQVAREPNNPALFLRRGDLYRAHQDWKLAEDDYQRAAQLDPQLAAVDLCRGKLFAESGRLPEAKTALDKFLQRQPHHGDALLTRGRLLAKLEQIPAAIDDFSTALDHMTDPVPDYYLERAALQTKAGQLAQALQGLDAGMKRLGPLLSLQMRAIELDLGLRQYDSALRRLDTQRDPAARQEKWLVRRAEILALAGRVAEARDSYQAATQAIAALPARLQQTPAMNQLTLQIQRAVAALGEKHSPINGPTPAP